METNTQILQKAQSLHSPIIHLYFLIECITLFSRLNKLVLFYFHSQLPSLEHPSELFYLVLELLS